MVKKKEYDTICMDNRLIQLNRCNFYNTGVSFGMLLFITFGANALWDLFSGLSCLRTK